MRKIIISKTNLQEVLNCPVVCGVEKLSEAEGWDKDFLLVYIRGLKLPVTNNDILVKNDYGRWFCMRKSDYTNFVEHFTDEEVGEEYPTCSFFSSRHSKIESQQKHENLNRNSENKYERSKMDKDIQKKKDISPVIRVSDFQRLLMKVKDFWQRHDQYS